MSADQQLLCVGCVLLLMVPYVQVSAYPEGNGPVEHLTGPQGDSLLAAVVEARQRGARIELNHNQQVGVFAVTTYRGDAVCAAHVRYAPNGHRTPAPYN